jgi:hypothetical protein
LEFSDILGRVLQLRRPLTLDMSHTLVQKYVGSVGVGLGKEDEVEGEGEGGGEGESEEKKERQIVRALTEAVVVGVEEEMNVYY